MFIDPYHYVRWTTLGMGTLWTGMGIRRLFLFGDRWRERMLYIGLKESWMKRQVLIFALRTTILDPINLGLILILMGTWMLRAFIEA